jgi:lysyl-tRNA synthetase, class I
MSWLDKVINEAVAAKPEGEIIVESGVSPSGTYHVGTLREVLTSDAILRELRSKGRQAKHVHYVDDMDVFRKVPANVSAEFDKYLGKPYFAIPAPDGSDQSYADYFLSDFLKAADKLGMDMEIIRSHEQYQSGAMTEAIEKALASIDKIRQIIEQVSGRKLEKDWAPIQVIEDGYLKNRRFSAIDADSKSITYLDADGSEQKTSYASGDVKLNWRVDWPARWWKIDVDIEPFGRDHATKGGSYDSGAAIVKDVFGAAPPLPVPYNFINAAGETKKMSKSSGNIIAISEMTEVLPPEIIRFFTLRYPPEKQLFFDQSEGVTKLIDEYAALLAKDDKTPDEEKVLELSKGDQPSAISSVPFSHLVASYQAAGRDADKTLQVIGRTEHARATTNQAEIIKEELGFIAEWLEKWAPEEIRFSLQDDINPVLPGLSDQEKGYLRQLADEISQAPADANGEWFHKAIYEIKESQSLTPEQIFRPLYRILINKDSGPRAGWFLNDLYIQDKEWLIKRLRLEA